MIEKIDNADLKCEIALNILHQLPEWFGIEESTLEYVKNSRTMDMWAAVKNGQYVGFIAARPTSDAAMEVYVMGVLKDVQGQGIGRQLFSSLYEDAKHKGYHFIQVKTVAMGHYECYDKTNLFYQSLGFKELECFPTLWDKHNPCQIYVMAIL